MASNPDPATMAPRLPRTAKESILFYFGLQHEHVANSRKAAKNNPFQLQPDTLKRLTTETGNTSFNWVLNQEASARVMMKHNLCHLAGSHDLHLDLPNECSYRDRVPVLHFPDGDVANEELIKKLGIALREIEETKQSIRDYMRIHEEDDYYLWSVWDMEMYKMQNAYTTLKKKVLSD
jgi:hypothetical protein